MTKDEALTVALQQIEVAVEYIDHLGGESGMYRAALGGLKKSFTQPEQDTRQFSNLSNQAHGFSQPVQPEPWTPEDTAYRPGGLSLTDWEAVAADQAMTIAMMKIEQEPVAVTGGGKTYQDLEFLPNAPQLENGTLLYTSPPQRQPLTDDEIKDVMESCLNDWDWQAFARAIEAKLKEKNT